MTFNFKVVWKRKTAFLIVNTSISSGLITCRCALSQQRKIFISFILKQTMCNNLFTYLKMQSDLFNLRNWQLNSRMNFLSVANYYGVCNLWVAKFKLIWNPLIYVITILEFRNSPITIIIVEVGIDITKSPGCYCEFL